MSQVRWGHFLVDIQNLDAGCPGSDEPCHTLIDAHKSLDVSGNERCSPAMPAPNGSSPNRMPVHKKAHKADESPSAKKTRSVHVRFRPSEGCRLQRPEPTTCPGGGALWTDRPILMERADGTYELIGTSRNLEGLARWILSFGPSAEVRSPDRLERQVALLAWRVWKKYAGDLAQSR